MLSVLHLNGIWKLRGFDGVHGLPEKFCASHVDERSFIDAQVPGEVHLDLERAGWIPDCNIGFNAQAARWVEEQVWVYRTNFDAPRDALTQHVWLVFDGLDLDAIIYLNGEEIGRHNNAFVPCRLDVTGKLRERGNSLAARIESGLYSVSDKPGFDYNHVHIDHALHKRSWLRKPQYQFSWDWNPRLINVGIWRGVRLEWTDSVRIDEMTVCPELSPDHTNAVVQARVFVDSVLSELTKAVLRLRVAETDAVVECEVQLLPGQSEHHIAVDIANPKLWWPLHHGDQPLYHLQLEIEVTGEVVGRTAKRTGIRSIRINQDKHPEAGQYFLLEVNGRPIFAKGGNWVPPDTIYARTDNERYRQLVDMAVEANFNMLRIWGGGLYGDYRFLDACDEAGIMVWHDFLFACTKYPADDPVFLNNVRREVTHVVRNLSAHPSLLVWCGNNELEWGYWEWGTEHKPYPDYALFHFEIPKILDREDPSRPYHVSSPSSPGLAYPNDPTTGDQHVWSVTIQGDGPDFWAYRDNISRFPNEGGVLGASPLATLKQFLPKDDFYPGSPVWEFHDNAVNFYSSPGVCYESLNYWLGVNADRMTVEDYAFYSGILQSEGLQEYINNFRRRMFSSACAIFWMYNDSWPTTHGWTIVDYYLRRKLPYHPVRRAFAPVHVIIAQEDDQVCVYGVNDRQEPWTGDVRFGLFKLSGGLPVDQTQSVTLPANTSTLLASLPMSAWQSLGTDSSGAFALLTDDGCMVAQNRLFVSRFKDLKWSESQISVTRRGSQTVFLSPVFAWGVCIDLSGEQVLADNMFDLLPGIEYAVDWSADQLLPRVLRCASDFAGQNLPSTPDIEDAEIVILHPDREFRK